MKNALQFKRPADRFRLSVRLWQNGLLSMALLNAMHGRSVAAMGLMRPKQIVKRLVNIIVGTETSCRLEPQTVPQIAFQWKVSSIESPNPDHRMISEMISSDFDKIFKL